MARENNEFRSSQEQIPFPWVSGARVLSYGLKARRDPAAP
jgi:hypothetical protein